MTISTSPSADGSARRMGALWGYSALVALWAYALIRPARLWTWEYYHDTPLLNYAAVLMHDFGRVPYRDIFETTMPGTFLFHYIIVGLGLETQTAFVTLGLIAMFALAAAGTYTLWRITPKGALLFAPFYLMVMLQFGPTALFQREILGLLAITPALILAPLLITFLWLWSYDALEPFLFILTQYTPLYIQLTQLHAFLTPEDRMQYLKDLWPTFAGFWILLPGPLMLAMLTFATRARMARDHLILLATFSAMTAIYGLLPILSGQFWDYHYFPFIFFAILSSSALLGVALTSSHPIKMAGLAMVALSLFLSLNPVANLEIRRADAITCLLPRGFSTISTLPITKAIPLLPPCAQSSWPHSQRTLQNSCWSLIEAKRYMGRTSLTPSPPLRPSAIPATHASRTPRNFPSTCAAILHHDATLG